MRCAITGRSASELVAPLATVPALTHCAAVTQIASRSDLPARIRASRGARAAAQTGAATPARIAAHVCVARGWLLMVPTATTGATGQRKRSHEHATSSPVYAVTFVDSHHDPPERVQRAAAYKLPTTSAAQVS